MMTLHSPLDPDDHIALWPCVVAFVACILVVILVSLWPRAGQPVAVMFPPWTPLAQIDAQITQAGGDLVDYGTVAGLVMAVSEDPHFIRQLYKNGAFWAMDGSFAASICAVPQA